jgi:hypothetical protein
MAQHHLRQPTTPRTPPATQCGPSMQRQRASAHGDPHRVPRAPHALGRAACAMTPLPTLQVAPCRPTTVLGRPHTMHHTPSRQTDCWGTPQCTSIDPPPHPHSWVVSGATPVLSLAPCKWEQRCMHPRACIHLREPSTGPQSLPLAAQLYLPTLQTPS